MSSDETFTPDRPLDAGALDPLASAHGLVKAIARFLSDVDTHPPLTLAISGEWGSGKSSVLKLLHDELRAHGLPVVLFNAYQHQTEQDLLAAVLQRIEEAAPPWWHLGGINFHRRLLLIRLARRRRFLIGLTTVVTFISGYIVANHNGSLVASIASWWPTPQQIQQSGIGIWVWLIAASPVLALIISLAELLLKGRPLSGRVKRAELHRKRDFRGRVADDLRDIVDALKPHTPTLLIDDLDRCSPRAVVNVLDAVNVLVNASNCFVTIGIARSVVERSLHLHLSLRAEEISDHRARVKGAAETAEPKLRDLSARYLSRLISVEIALPAPGIASVYGAPEPSPIPIASAWRNRALTLKGVAVILSIFAMGLIIGGRFRLAESAGPAFSVGALSVSWFVLGWFGCLAALGFVAAIYTVARLFERRYFVEVAEHEPERAEAPHDLRRAFETWSTVIVELSPTPRGLRQFVNQVRLLAHLGAERIPISTAVALLTLRRLDREILEGDDIDHRLIRFLNTRDGAFRASVTEAVNTHRERFGWPPSMHEIRRLRESMQLIRVD